MTGFVEFDLTGLLVNGVVPGLGDFAFDFFNVQFQLRDQFIDLHVQLGAVLGLTGNDQRGTRFVDEDGVDFVDHGKVEFALEFFFHAERHVVAQVVETEFVVGAVGDVGGVRQTLLFRWLERRHDADGQAEEFIQRTHPVGVTTRQVVVHRHNVHALAGQRVEVNAQGRYEGFTLTGAHFGNLAFVQVMPPTSCTSKWRIPMMRLPASRATAKASGNSLSRFPLWRCGP